MASTVLGPPGWSMDAIAPVGYLSKKALPIKRNDAEPLTREDVQFDLLNYIFANTKAVFTAPPQGKTSTNKEGISITKKLNFRELYVNALFNSTKCSKVLKDKMLETPAFAIELAKISLLTNVGRINTTMAFFPEMKTALRTYHPVPSLQKTDGNAQDAPRIKNCLKAALLPSEFKSVPPSTPEEILDKNKAGQIPPTSVVNLVFVLASHAAPLASIHFDGALNFLDLFLPRNLSSADRAKCFLWHMFHYLEPSHLTNPFNDDFSRQNRAKCPLIRQLSDIEAQRENVDTPDEIEWGNRMSSQRNNFLQRLVSSIEKERKMKHSPPPLTHAVENMSLNMTSSRKTRHRTIEEQRDAQPFMYYVPPIRERAPRPVMKVEPSVTYRGSSGSSRDERTMLQYAWHNVMTTDPLVDSDEENADEHVRVEYSRRLGVLTRLRGRAATPEPNGYFPSRMTRRW